MPARDGDPSMSHCQCTSSALPVLVGDPAVTCSGGCGSTGGDLVTLPGSLGHAGAVGKGDAAGSMCCIRRCNTQPAPDPEMHKQNLPFLTAFWSISLRLPRALGTSYLGNDRVLRMCLD